MKRILSILLTAVMILSLVPLSMILISAEPDSQYTSGEDISGDDSLIEDTSSEDTSNEDTSNEDTSSEDTSNEDTSSEDTSSEDTSNEDTSSEDTSSEDTSSEDTSSEDTSSEDTSSEDTSSEDTSSEDTSSEDTSSEDTSSDDTSSDDTSSDEFPGRINVALNKTYTGAEVSPVNPDYCANLTDGVASNEQEYDSNWFAFYYNKWAPSENNNASFSVGEIIVELEETVDGITDIRMHVWNHNMSGIAAAKSITVFVSDDCVSFTKIGELAIPEGDEPDWATLSVDYVSAKYVKFVVQTQDVWTFLNEIEIYADPEYVPDDSPIGGTSSEKPSGVNVALGKNYLGGAVSPVNPDYSANLTDGQASDVAEFDSRWFGFYYNEYAFQEDINAPDGVGTIVIDLDEVVNNITDVRVHVWNANNAGVSPAKSITLYVSEDGEDFKEVGKLNIPDAGEPSWATIHTDNISAHYVIIVVETQDTWTFLNEIEVYATEENADTADIDTDGDVDASDYILIKRAVLNTYKLSEAQAKVADIDKDGDVDATDYVLVKRIVLGTYTVK